MPRREYLYVIRFWEARRILAGHQRRSRDVWSAVRWSTYYIMAAQVGGKELDQKGIHGPKDLLPLPWDMKAEKNIPLTQAEVEQEVAMMNAINKELRAKREKDSE